MPTFPPGDSLASLGAEAVANKSTDITLGGSTPSDILYPSQKAAKAYIDALAEMIDALLYKGAIDCSGNPNYPAADTGHVYYVSVAGKIGGASGDAVEIGDLLLCKTDGSAAGTKAAVGANWDIVQGNTEPLVPGVDYQPPPVQIPYTSATPWTPTPVVGTAGAEIRFTCASVDHDLAFGVPTGTPVQGQTLIMFLTSDASAHAISFSSSANGYLAGNQLPLPTITISNELIILNFKWSTTRSKWLYTGTLGGF